MREVPDDARGLAGRHYGDDGTTETTKKHGRRCASSAQACPP